MAYLVLPPEFIPWISTIVNWVMSFTPLITYGSTILGIRRRQSSEGFSLDICSTMLISATLRIFYYFNEPFEISLLRQCFVMVSIQTVLLYVALKYRPEESQSLEVYDCHWDQVASRFVKINGELALNDEREFCRDINGDYLPLSKRLLGGLKVLLLNWQRNSLLFGLCLVKVITYVLSFFDAHYIRPFRFWQWSNTRIYWAFLLVFVLVVATLQSLFLQEHHFTMAIASVSFLVESTLPLPQILLFFRVKTVRNFKTILLVSWLAGDLTKISYLIYGTNNVGYIFIVAALFQMSLNLVITCLFIRYKKMDMDREAGILPMSLPSSAAASPMFEDPSTANGIFMHNLSPTVSPSENVSPALLRRSSVSFHTPEKARRTTMSGLVPLPSPNKSISFATPLPRDSHELFSENVASATSRSRSSTLTDTGDIPLLRRSRTSN